MPNEINVVRAFNITVHGDGHDLICHAVNQAIQDSNGAVVTLARSTRNSAEGEKATTMIVVVTDQGKFVPVVQEFGAAIYPVDPNDPEFTLG